MSDLYTVRSSKKLELKGEKKKHKKDKKGKKRKHEDEDSEKNTFIQDR